MFEFDKIGGLFACLDKPVMPICFNQLNPDDLFLS